MKTNNKGFSLVELIVVIAIMAILAAVAIPTFAGFISKAQVGADEDFMNQAAYAIKLANTATADFTLTEVKVVVDNNGTIESITYNTSNVIHKPAELGTGSPSDQEVDASGAIDWDYQFKKYKGTTVTLTYDEGEPVVTVPNT